MHYLIGTVPGLALATAAAAVGGIVRRLALDAVLACAGLIAAAGVAVTVVTSFGTTSSDLTVEHYLSTHERPGDTGVIGFGDPSLLQAAHLSSPYPQLWSLAVRVRDPYLTQFTSILGGRDRPPGSSSTVPASRLGVSTLPGPAGPRARLPTQRHRRRLAHRA